MRRRGLGMQQPLQLSASVESTDGVKPLAAGAEQAAAAAAAPETEDASEAAATPPATKKAGRGGEGGRN